MNVLGIVCSSRKGGNTEILVREALNSAKDCSAEIELVTVAGKDIKPCDGCRSCVKTGKCRIKDDMQAIYPKLLNADGIIWGTPVYFYSAAAQAKILMDRCYTLYHDCKLANKVGGVISVAGSLGHMGVWNLFNTFFSVNHMFPADFVSGFAGEKGDVRKDKLAMKASAELGKQVVSLVQRQCRFPAEYDVNIPRYVRDKYGIGMSPARGRFGE